MKTILNFFGTLGDTKHNWKKILHNAIQVNPFNNLFENKQNIYEIIGIEIYEINEENWIPKIWWLISVEEDAITQ